MPEDAPPALFLLLSQGPRPAPAHHDAPLPGFRVQAPQGHLCIPPPPSPCVTVTSVSPEVVALDHLSVIFHTGHLQMTLTVQAETSRVGLCVQASLVTCKCLVSGQWGHCGVQDGLPVRAQMAELPVFYSLRVRRVDSVYLSWTSACRMQEMLSSPLPQSCITLS